MCFTCFHIVRFCFVACLCCVAVDYYCMFLFVCSSFFRGCLMARCLFFCHLVFVFVMSYGVVVCVDVLFCVCLCCLFALRCLSITPCG